MSALTQTAGGTILAVHAVPRASRTEICGFHGDAVKIRLQAPPVGGKANKGLITFLSKKLRIPAGRISLLSGETGRSKRLLIRGASTDMLRDKLELSWPHKITP